MLVIRRTKSAADDIRWKLMQEEHLTIQSSNMFGYLGHRQEEGIDYEEVFAPVCFLMTGTIEKRFKLTLPYAESASTPVDLEKPLVKDGDSNDVDMLPFELVAYTDSDYARATQDRKSTTEDLLTKGFDTGSEGFSWIAEFSKSTAPQFRSKDTTRQEQEKYDFEKALELQKQLDEIEEVVAKATQAHDIDWSDPTVLRYHALQIRSSLLAEVMKEHDVNVFKESGRKQRRCQYNGKSI
ncbi:hypothetical protein Tco_0818136 [Tanacetum coccineum]